MAAGSTYRAVQESGSTSAFIDELAARVADTPHKGFWLRYTNIFMGREMHHGVPQRKLALFRHGSGRYEHIAEDHWSDLDMEVHEHPIVEGSVGELSTPILHDDYRGLDHFLARHASYATWEAQRYFALRRDQDAWSRLTRRQRIKYGLLRSVWLAPSYFLFTYLLRLGVLDGGVGYAYAFLKMSYFFQIRLKILELERNATA